jgi:predicted component of type VI protein secretion system
MAEGRFARLTGIEGPVEGQDFPIDRAEMGIGRRSDCEIVVPDPSVSRLHARLRQVNGIFLIEDANSANGTWVNGVRLAGPQQLVERDVIRIGKAAFTFRSEVQPAGVPPGSMTMVSDLGDEPSPFDEPAFPQHGQLSPVPTPPTAYAAPPPAWDPAPPAPTPVEPLAPPPPAPIPMPMPVPARQSNAVADQDLQAQLDRLRQELGPFIERLSALSTAAAASSGGVGSGSATPPALQALLDDVQANGGPERYQELEHLLDELRSDPHDLRLLLRLSEELPIIARLLQTYLRALSIAREMKL